MLTGLWRWWALLDHLKFKHLAFSAKKGIHCIQKRKTTRTPRTVCECGEKEKHSSKGNLHPGSVACSYQNGEFIHFSVTLIAHYGKIPMKYGSFRKKPHRPTCISGGVFRAIILNRNSQYSTNDVISIYQEPQRIWQSAEAFNIKPNCMRHTPFDISLI